MSGFKQHAIGGVIASVTVAAGTFFVTKVLGIGFLFGVATFVGSLAPDIDTSSIPSKWFARIGLVLSAVLMYHKLNQEAAIVGMIYMAMSSDKHRGFSHSWLLMISCFAIGALGCLGKMPNYFSLLAPFAFGIFVHAVIIDRR